MTVFTDRLLSAGLRRYKTAAATQAAVGVQSFIERAARGAEFHGPLTRPDGTQLGEIARVVDAAAICPVR